MKLVGKQSIKAINYEENTSLMTNQALPLSLAAADTRVRNSAIPVSQGNRLPASSASKARRGLACRLSCKSATAVAQSLMNGHTHRRPLFAMRRLVYTAGE
jgi:hypothetical protein